VFIFSFAFYFFAGINFLLALFVFFFVPETKKVSLEEMDVLFGGTNHVEKGGDLLHVEDAHHAKLGTDNMSNRNDTGDLENTGSDDVELGDHATQIIAEPAQSKD